LFAVLRIVRYNIKSFTRSAERVGTYNGSIRKKDVVGTTKTAKSAINFVFKKYLEN
jgi:hypothetical protein